MLRSFLYVPAHSDRFVARAHERGADAIILDLEDSVLPDQKATARAALATAIPSVRQNGAKVFVRVNADWEMMQLDAIAACQAGADGLFVPKASNVDGLLKLSELLTREETGQHRAPMDLVPMIEDPGAVLDARAILSCTPRILGVVTGGEDLATTMNAQPTPDVLRIPKIMVHLAAKAVGVLSFGLIRTVADFNDHAGITESIREARTFGFDGATCVHPSVVALLNQGFAPSQEELATARAMIEAFDARETKDGAFLFEGRMVDAPILARARKLLALT